MSRLILLIAWLYVARPVHCMELTAFTISSINYFPNLAESIANVSVTFASTETVPTGSPDVYTVRVEFPAQFVPKGVEPSPATCTNLYQGSGSSVVDECIQLPTSGIVLLYGVGQALGISPIIYYDELARSVFVRVTGLEANSPVTVEFCCLKLPASFVADSSEVSITLMKKSVSGSMTVLIPKRPIQRSPRILIAATWTDLFLRLDPATPSSESAISLVFSTPDSLPAGARIVAALPGFVCGTEAVIFTVSTLPELSVNLFEFVGTWANEELIFVLASELPPNVQVTVTTVGEGQFRLPESLALNSPDLTLSAVSADMEYIEATAFRSADEVLPEYVFLSSEIFVPEISQWNTPSDLVEVEFSFALNRSLFPGTSLVLRLPGYQASARSVGAGGSFSEFFENTIFDPKTSTFSTKVVHAIYFDGSGNDAGSLVWSAIRLPAGQYANDASLGVAIAGGGLAGDGSFQSILTSQAFGVEKFFAKSELVFDRPEPGRESGILVRFEPTVALFAGTRVRVWLRGGFVRAMAAIDIPLLGEDAIFFANQVALYDDLNNRITFVVDSVLEGPVEVGIPLAARIRLPEHLSQNDQSLLIEAVENVAITAEPVKKVAGFGTEKMLTTDAKISFFPLRPETEADILLGLIFNTDILPSSILCLHLGGFNRTDGGPVELDGVDAPLFTNVVWNHNAQNLTMVLPALLPAGTLVSVTIPFTEGFILPFTLARNDKSIFLTVDASGLDAPQFFQTSDRVNNKVAKEMLTSTLYFGRSESDVPIAGTLGILNFEFMASFAIRPGARMRIELNGFVADEKENAQLRDVTGLEPNAFRTDDTNHFVGSWNQTTSVLEMVVEGEIRANSEFAFSIFNFFTLPARSLVNSDTIRVSIGGSQILDSEKLKRSREIVPASFEISTLDFAPKIPSTTAAISLTLVATVGLVAMAHIEVELTGFKREENSGSLDLRATVDGVAVGVSVDWNEPVLSVRLVTAVAAHTTIRIVLEESAGLILPATLALNDESLTVGVGGLIPKMPFAQSPLLGDGPFAYQRFCAYMLETGVRYSLLQLGGECQVSDVCSESELERCGFGGLLDEPVPLVVAGFQLRESDTLRFVKASVCKDSPTSSAIQFSSSILTQAGLEFASLRALQAGTFTLCITHLGIEAEAGLLSVRPGCPAPSVMLETSCVDHCPFGFLPVSGECVVATPTGVDDSVSLVLSLTYPNADALGIAKLSKLDSTFEFFIFFFVENLRAVLYEDKASRFLVTAISAGWDVKPNRLPDTLVVSVVVTPASVGSPRSAGEIKAVLAALKSDKNSAFYSNQLFKNSIETPQFVSLSAVGGAGGVFYCPLTDSFNTLCPLVLDPLPISPLSTPSWFYLTVILGGLVGGFLFVALLIGLYRSDNLSAKFRKNKQLTHRHSLVDMDNNFSIIKIRKGQPQRIRRDPALLDPSAQAEFARGWLDGQLVDEELWRRGKVGEVGGIVGKVEIVPPK